MDPVALKTCFVDGVNRQVATLIHKVLDNGGRMEDVVAFRVGTGNDGIEVTPFTSVDDAVAALTAEANIVLVMPGDHTITDTLSLPAFNCSIVGMLPGGLCSINAADTVTPLISIAPASLSATVEYTLANLHVDNAETSQVGLQVDNTNAGKKIIIQIKGCPFSDGGNAIDVDHDGASDAVRIYINNNGEEIEGAINFDVGNNGDRLRIDDAMVSGGLVTGTDATVAEFLFRNCTIKHEGITGGNAAQTVTCVACVSDNGAGTYAKVDTSDLAGSHTENIIAFT